MSNSSVILSVDNRGVATVTLDRPEKHNAFDEHVIADLTAAFEQVSADPNIRVMVLSARGKTFSAGADLNWMKRMAKYSTEKNLEDANNLARMFHTLYFMPAPTIASVRGAAYGGGAGLVCCCDIAIAASDVLFAFSETRLGLIPATISPYVIQTIGSKAARHYFITAERFNASRARELGMLLDVLPDKIIEERVEELVNGILKNGPRAVRAAKQLVFAIEGKHITSDLIQETCQRIADTRASDEGKEGLSAFLERRNPSWIN
jgi:methylglutaconyl-CoA hydratase